MIPGALTPFIVIIKSHTDAHSLGPGRVVSGADTVVVAGRVSGVGANVVAMASGKGVVLTLLGAVVGDLIATNFAEVTGETSAGESV